MDNRREPDGTDLTSGDRYDSSTENAAPSSGSWRSIGIYLFLFAAGIFCLIRYFDAELGRIAIAAIGLGFVIFIHELGHFLVAKACDVHVETFSIGFGPALPGCSFRRGETTYMLALVPLGGYVKMVGEGPEAEDGEDDPRSFKNKPVWQRMAIISAGVTMNVLLAIACFVFVYRTHGAERAPGVVDRVDPGSPAWKLGVRTGDVIHWIGNKGPDPYFDDLQPVVMNSKKNEKLNFVWSEPGAPERSWHRAEIEPRKTEDDDRPIIGISPPYEPALVPEQFRRVRRAPYFYTSAVAAAEPPFDFGDVIVGTSDPRHPEQVTPLPPDPRGSNHGDYFDYVRRLQLLAGKEIQVRVRREGSPEEITIKVPPAYHYVLGLRMRMGRIASVRDDSPASRAGLQPEDIIDRVEVADANDHVIRYVTSRSKGPLRAGLTEVDLDPLRLRFDLRNWALGQHSKSRKPVELTVLRTNASNPVNHTERQELRLKIDWDESWQFENESPASVNSPFSIPELGLAYRVETRVEGVAPASSASAARVDKGAEIKFKAGDVIRRNGEIITAHEGDTVLLQPGDQINLLPGDVIRSCRFLVHGPKPDSDPKPGEWQEIKSDQWAYVFYVLQQEADYKQISIVLERDRLELTLEAVEDRSWPTVRRGLWLANDKRLQKADSFGEALTLGLQETGNFISQIYQNLRGIITRRVSPKNFGGPIAIFTMAYRIAQDPYRFLLFLGIISVNLAVINFLPIPVLDGGHMVFLAYEKVRGKPAPKRVLEAATYAGLAFIVLLMISVIYLDLSRL